MPSEVLYVRVPAEVKAEAEKLAERHATSLASVVARALEVYLTANGAKFDAPAQLP